MSNITISKWQAWINLMPIQPTFGGTLHTTGEADTNSTDFAFLEKAIPQGFNPKILLLKLKVETGIAPVTNPQQLHYKEELQQKNQYTIIEIHSNGNLEATITDLKKVH
jgi:hypothetical protein